MKQSNLFNKTRLVYSGLLLLAGIFAVVASLFIPPTGIIHPSVLTALGELLAFSAAFMGIDEYFTYLTKKVHYREDSDGPKVEKKEEDNE